MSSSFQDSLQPLSDRERKLLERLMSHPDQIPQVFWAAVKKKIEADPPSLLASDIQGLQNQFLMQSYTPSWACSVSAPSLGNGSLIARYIKIGQLVCYELELVAGTTTAFGSGQWFFTLPLAANVTNLTANALKGIGFDTSSGNMVLLAGDVNSAVVTNQTINVYYAAASPGALTVLQSTAPWTWANGDVLRVHGTYFAV